MKKIISSIGLIVALIAIILAVSPISNAAITPMLLGFVCGLILVYISKNQKTKPKVIQYIFLLSLFTLVLLIYKNTSTAEAPDKDNILKQDRKHNSNESESKLENILSE